MAQITFFHYIDKNSWLHRMDGRLKIPCLLLLTIAAGAASAWLHYALLLAVILGALFASQLPLLPLLKDLRLFAVIIVFVFIANAWSLPGDPLPFLPVPGVSLQGIIAGSRFAGRLVLIVLACAVMTGTTPLSVFKNVIEWYVRPLPFVPAARVAAMISLTFVFTGVIFDTYAEMKEAQRARCVDISKNPVRRVKLLLIPLLSLTLKRADEVVCAMEARCYTEVRTRAEFVTYGRDWVVLMVCGGVLFFCLLYLRLGYL